MSLIAASEGFLVFAEEADTCYSWPIFTPFLIPTAPLPKQYVMFSTQCFPQNLDLGLGKGGGGLSLEIIVLTIWFKMGTEVDFVLAPAALATAVMWLSCKWKISAWRPALSGDGRTE